MGPAPVFSEVDNSSAQAAKVARHRLMEFMLDQQMKRLDMQRCDLTDGRMVGHFEAALPERRVDTSGLHSLESLLRSGHRVQLDPDRIASGLPPERTRDAMASSPLLPRGHPQSDRPLLRLEEREKGCKTKCR